MATFTGAARTANTFVGTAADDLFRFAAAEINARDSVTGGGGIDRLQLTSAGILADTALAGVKGVEQIALANGANAIKLVDANFTGVIGGKIAVSGGSGNDRIDASSLTGANRIDVSSGGGLDVLRGGAGADVFRFAAPNLGGDTVVGGGGSDLLVLTTGGGLGTGGMGLVSGIETIQLAGAGNAIALTNANFAGVAGAKIVVTGGAGADHVNASALTGANRVDITAGAGAGVDVLRGGAGADVFRFAAANMAGDTVSGGLGSDLLVLTTGGALGTGGLTRVSGVETIALAAGGNPITLTNANFAGVLGAKIAVRGSAGADIVDASGLTGANAIDVTAGLGADVLRGGAGADVFRFAAANMAGDTVTGGLGSDLLVLTTGGALGTGGITRVSGVETIALAAGGNPITLTNANFVGVLDAKIAVIGGASDNTVNAAGLTGVNRIDVTAGAGLDTLRGGAGADVFRFAFLNLRGDVIAGGAGSDTVLLTTAGGLPSNALRSMTGVERVLLAADGNAITLENANFTGVAGAKITVIGGAGANPNTVNGSGLTGANAIDVTAGGGLDVLRGGAGNDVFRFTKARLDGDTVQGGGGIDTLLLTTTGGLGGTALAHVTGVETIRFAVGGNTLAIVDANFAGVAGGVIKVIGGGGPNLVDAALLKGSNKIDVTAGKDIDSLTSGAGDDVFRFAAAYLTSADTVQGGTGYDTLVLTTAGTVGSLAGVTGIDRINLAAGGNSLKLTDANYSVATYFGELDVIGAARSSVIDGTDLTSTHGIYFLDGGAADTIMGGAGRDRLVLQNGNVFVTGDTFNGGGGNVDAILIDRSMDFLVGTISNVEQLLTFSSGATNVTISGENAAGFDTFGSFASNLVDGIFTVQLSAGSTTDLSNLTLVQASAGDAINVVATSGSTTITLSSSIASFTGSAGDDTVRFAADQTYAGGAVIAGGGGIDQITLITSGDLAVDALANVTGIEQIVLAAGGNSLTLTDANFAVPIAGKLIISASAGSSSITGSDLTGTNGLYVYDGGGIDTIIGGAGADVLDLRGRVFVAGDTFDGGDGNDGIAIDRSMDLLGSTISHVEQLLNFGTNAVNVSISGENAAAMLSMGNAGANGVDDVFTIQLSAGSTTDLSNLTLNAPDAADAINVVAHGGSTTVTLSSSIASFTGSADSDTVSLAPGGRYMAEAVISGGGGDDRIAYDSSHQATLDGGEGTDTLLMFGSASIDLRLSSPDVIGPHPARNFENVDASASSDVVALTGADHVQSILIGGSGDDFIFAGVIGATITGGLGADQLQGFYGNDRFHISSTAEAQGDTIVGDAGDDGIDVLGSADLTGAAISGIETLFLAAADAAGNFTADDLTATVTGAQAAALAGIFGNGYNTTSVETLVVKMNSASLDLSGLGFSYWGANDRAEINGTTGTDTIIGTSQNDVILGGGGDDTISGGNGDDTLGYSSIATILDGGAGNDTVKFVSDPYGVDYSDVNLATQMITETVGESETFQTSVTGFENADFSAAVQTVYLTGTDANNILITGSAADTLTGGLGADTLTGGGGADDFVWNDKLEGGDTITDFERGTDKLVFSAAQFGFSNASFDTAIEHDVLLLDQDFSNADLIVTSSRLSDATQVQFFVDALFNAPSGPMFVIARDANRHAALYYLEGNAGGAYLIADLGGGRPSDFTLSDFVFI